MVSGISTATPVGPKRRFGIWLIIGLVLVPWACCWLLLRRGYSATERLLAFGWAAVVISTAVLQPHATAPPPPDPAQKARDTAEMEARLMVPKMMRDPLSAQFGQVVGRGPHMACGTVNGKNSFGALVGQKEFIYVAGSVEFNDGSRKFARHWNTICVDKLLTTAPTGVSGHRWGSRPTPDLKEFTTPTEDGLALYVPKTAPAPLEGVPVKEADFRYDHGRLYAADLFIDGEAGRDAVKMALAKKYGSPLSADTTAQSYQWSWPERKVSIDMSYQEKTARTQVTFSQGAH